MQGILVGFSTFEEENWNSNMILQNEAMNNTNRTCDQRGYNINHSIWLGMQDSFFTVEEVI